MTDHHIPPEDPPDSAVAVLDPKLWDPDDPLAGVGVAWKFAWAVARELGDPEGKKRLGRLLDLVSVGTVVDIAPLVGDNRALAIDGPQAHEPGALPGMRRPGIEALVKVAGVRGELDEGDLGWKLGPRLNSIGRIKNPRPALDLLLTRGPREANRIAWELNQLNSERQHRTRYAVERAMAEVDPEQDFKVVVTDGVRGDSPGSSRAGSRGRREAGGDPEPAGRTAHTVVRPGRGRRTWTSTGRSLRGAAPDGRVGRPPQGGGALGRARQVRRVRRRGKRGGAGAARGGPGGLRSRARGGRGGLALDERIERACSTGTRSSRRSGAETTGPSSSREGLRIEGSRQLWEGMNLLRLRRRGEGEDGRRRRGGARGGFRRRVHGVPQPRTPGQAELEIVDLRK